MSEAPLSPLDAPSIAAHRDRLCWNSSRWFILAKYCRINPTELRKWRNRRLLRVDASSIIADRRSTAQAGSHRAPAAG